jgi:uncharacterized protein (DUF362 family)
MISDNPFLHSPDGTWVTVAHGEGPYVNARRALARVDLSAARGRRVLLKPNAGRVAPPESGVTTHPEAVAAAIDAFREAGAEVAVGESPIAGVQVQEAYEVTGIAAVAQTRQCPLIDLDRRPFVEVPIPQGRVIHRLQVCPEVLEYDLLVSMPVMKMHMHTGVTLSVKNLKGCLWRRSKVQLHMLPPVDGTGHKPIDLAIADLASVLRPHLAIIDGAIGMEGLGPSAGQPKALDAVVVGADAFAADAVACRLMGTEAEAVAHLRLGADRGYGVIDLDRITVTPEHWRDWISPFVPPPRNLQIEFPNITVLDGGACSACQSTLLLFLKSYKDRLFDYFPAEFPIHIAIGKNHTDVPVGTLCIGNCTARYKERGLFVPGCPPVSSGILAALGQSAVDTADGRITGQGPSQPSD